MSIWPQWAKGMAWFKVDEDGKLTSTIAKNFSDELLAKIAERMGAEPGDLLLFSADQWDVTCRVLNGLRKKMKSFRTACSAAQHSLNLLCLPGLKSP